MTLLRGDFSVPGVEPTPEVVSLARQAAAHLSAFTGRAAQVRRMPRIAVAQVVEGGHVLAISVGLYAGGPMPRGEDVAAWRAKQADADKVIGVDVHADAAWLVRSELATEGKFGDAHAFAIVKDVEAAADWVRQRCLRTPEPLVTAEDVAAWDRRTLVTHQGEMTLRDAVMRFGPRHGLALTVEMLTRDYGLVETDAVAVVGAVRKVLLRSRS